MLKMLVTIAVATGLCAGASAHPTDVYFSSRGECQAAYAKQNQADREMLVQFGIASTTGEAMRDIHNRFSCEYDDEVGEWHFVDLFAQDSTNSDDNAE